jgi:hypothetical protein
MTKIIEASCIQNNITVDGVILTDSFILSEGKGASDGILFINKDKSYYIANTSADLKYTIQSLSDITQQIIAALTALNALPTISGACAAQVTQLTTLKATLEFLEGNLK